MKKQTNPHEREKIGDYYDLKTEAVDALVNAEKDDGVPVTQEELDKYQRKSKFKLPDFLKIFLIKVWFAGAVYYFIGFGLGIKNLLDQIFVLSVAMGIVTDLLTNNVLRFLEETPGANDKWLLIARKGYASFVINIVFGFVVVLGVSGIYWLLELVADLITGKPEAIHIGTEPVFFGVFCTLVELALIGVKHLIMMAVDHFRK